ncbi:MAG: filamentous hemagglutinin N-terminal domain-containing protein [Sulfuricellaceae bacterium]
MNHIYRLVWSEIAHSFVAVSEIAKGRGKRSSATTVRGEPVEPQFGTNNWPSTGSGRTAFMESLYRRKLIAASLAFALTSAPAHALDLGALPTGGNVTAGSAAISQAANVLTVQQSSQRAAIDWQSFNIGASATVNFNQPNANAVALNRITGNSASEIYGKLNANGQVFFTNPNGMLFARGAQVNVGGILATTMSLGNDDFMAGNYRLTNPGSGSIRNEGIINALGSVALVGNTVQNVGQIIATTVTLVAGNTVAVDLTGDGLIRARVEDAALHASIENSGNVEGTQVTLTAGQARDTLDRVVNNSGVIRAIGLTMQGGEIVLEGGLLGNTGTLDASASLPSPAGGITSDLAALPPSRMASSSIRGAGGEGAFASGGSINLSGAAVSLGGTIAADGSTQGGNIAIDAGGVSLAGLVSATGGSGQGGNIDIQSQTTALHNVHSTLDVSGATGGSIREIAGHQITSSATYLATGTAGNGGHIDISASATKLLSAQIDASGTAGGGQIRVGGEYQGGKSPSPLAGEGQGERGLPNAETLAISAGSVITADATQQGNGGTVILWSDLTSALYADVSAKGKNGAGGFIELSSAEKLLWGGSANAGVGGQVLMDPKNIVIQDATAGSVQYNLTLGYNYIDLPGMKGNNLAASDYFGSAVSLSGTQLAVGAYGDDGSGNVTAGSGAVYLFNNPYTAPALSGIIGKGYTGAGNFDLIALAANDNFGISVSLSGTQLAVGAYGDDGFANVATESGAVYLFNTPFGTPALSGTIGKGYAGTGSFDLAALETWDNFGSAVSLFGTQLAVGAYGDDGFGNVAAGSGAVYLFNTPFGTPTLSGTIGKGYIGTGDFDAAALAASDQFGRFVSLSGTQLAVGAWGDDGFANVATDSGAVYLFNNPFGATTLSGIIGLGYAGAGDFNLTTLVAWDYFGSAVSLSGTQLAVGASGDDGFTNATPESGAVYLFNTPFATPALSGIIGKGYTGAGNYDLTALEAYDSFGRSVSLSGAQLAVGAENDSGSGNAVGSSGAVYLFNDPFTATTLYGTIGKGYTGAGNFDVSVVPEAGDYFGSAVSLSGTQLAVGAYQDDGFGNVASASGAVYLFNTPYTTPTLSGIIGKGYTGAGNFDLIALEASDTFGYSVSLTGAQLAVGAVGDNGSGNVASSSGAVYLFNTPFGTPTLSGIIGKGYTGGGNLDVAALEMTDYFGTSVSLSGTQLAVGAMNDGGSGNAASASGAVYLFNNLDTTPTLSGIIGKGYTGAGNYNLTALAADDNFGSSVSLSGTELAVGAYGDDGSGNVASYSGAVYLFGNPYTTPTLSGIIGRGYTGTGNYNLTALQASDFFGSSVSLSGTQLAVGAIGDGGSGNVASYSGAVYLFNNPFGATALSGIIGKGYTGAGNYDLAALEAWDYFGTSVSLSGTQLAVGAMWDDGSGNVASSSGAVYLFTLVPPSSDPATGQTFAANSALDSSITPASITAILNTGSALILQANNDITVTNAIIANNTGGNGGALTLQAGRSILVNANITTDNGALVLTANDTLANGVTDAYRDAGAANITMASGTTLDAGSGTINMQISNGAGLTNNTAGAMTVGNLTASAVNLASSGGNLNGNGTVSAGTFTLNSGTWNQVAATLPSFTATDFRIAGGTFIRALSGDGTTGTPYQLADIYGVQGMGSSGMLGKSYSLAVNVDASGTSGWNAGLGFAPIGDVTTQFTGTFDGLNHTISNLTINRPAAGYVGLFGNIATGGTVSNLGLLASNVVGSDFVGALGAVKKQVAQFIEGECNNSNLREIHCVRS